MDPRISKKATEKLLGAIRQRDAARAKADKGKIPFVSRRGDRVKVLTWERGGFVLWYKHLEQGRFCRPQIAANASKVQLEPDPFTLLIEGIDLQSVRRPKRWTPKGLDTRAKV